jgi:hypothetical protein
MGIRILNLSKLAPALVAVALLDFAAVARADVGSAPTPVPASATATAVEASSAATPKPDPSAAAVGSADAQGPSSALKEASQRDGHGEAVSGPQPEATAADPGRAREPSSTQAAQMSGTSISEAVHEAIRQATTGRPAGSGSGDEVTVAADSNATAQLIWQVQVSECSAHCFGTRQSQRAEQQNTTLQVLTGAQPTATDPATGGRARETTRVTQVQLGCISHCFGSSTTSSSPDSSTYQRVLEETLREIAAGLPSLGPTPALAQNTVEQASYQSQSGQSQSGAGQTLTQTQGASQANTTIQLYEAPASLIAGLETALGRAAATQNAVNRFLSRDRAIPASRTVEHDRRGAHVAVRLRLSGGRFGSGHNRAGHVASADRVSLLVPRRDRAANRHDAERAHGDRDRRRLRPASCRSDPDVVRRGRSGRNPGSPDGQLGAGHQQRLACPGQRHERAELDPRGEVDHDRTQARCPWRSITHLVHTRERERTAQQRARAREAA